MKKASKTKSSLLSRLKSAKLGFDVNTLSETNVFDFDLIKTDVPIINFACSGEIEGGLVPGHTAIAGASGNFKTVFAVMFAEAFLRKYEDQDGIVFWFDSELGAPPEYFEDKGVNPERVVHIPIETLEDFRTKITNLLETITVDDKAMIVVDSLSNLSSIKEREDSIDGSNKADMTKAKVMKSIFRLITTKMKINKFPMVSVNHSYETMEMFSKEVMTGGKGVRYSADTVWFIGKRKIKDGSTLIGHDFVINISKSRFIREGSKFDVSVTWEDGVYKWSGLLNLALDVGYMTATGKKYQKVDTETGELIGDPLSKRQLQNNDDFWQSVIDDEKFKQLVRDAYKLKTNKKKEEE